LIPAAAEESLRLWGSVFGLVRTTTQEVEIRGRTIPAGEVVALLWTSAGRDEDVHDNSDEFRLDRENMKHLSFGAGVHRCPGNDLARQTMRLAVEELLARTHSITLSGLPRRPGWPAVGVLSLPVTIEWADG
jgi:cytochrome P450